MAGLSAPRPFEKQSVKCSAGLIGEVYKQSDPQVTTEVQRSWLPATDASLANFHKGKTSQVNDKDNETSLPLGEGAHASFTKSDEPAYYRRIRRDVTIVKNNVIT